MLIRHVVHESQDSSADIAAGYGLDVRSSIPDVSKKLFATPQRPDRLLYPPSLLSIGYRGG
jgi:hypothetical protein